MNSTKKYTRHKEVKKLPTTERCILVEELERKLDSFDPDERKQALTALCEKAEAGEIEAALAFYGRADAADSDAPSYAYAAAQLLIREGRSAKAQDRLAELLVRHPHHAAAAQDLARLLVEQSRELDRALALAQRAIRFRAGSEAFEVLGWVQLERGESELAVEALHHAVELRPASASAQYRLGLALASAGDEDGARDALRRALEAGDFAEAERAKAELARLEARSPARP